MSFETNIADHIKTLETKGKQLYFERNRLVHDCSCSYCEYNGDVTEDNQEDWDKITAEMKEVEQIIEKVKQHAQRHKIKVPA